MIAVNTGASSIAKITLVISVGKSTIHYFFWNECWWLKQKSGGILKGCVFIQSIFDRNMLYQGKRFWLPRINLLIEVFHSLLLPEETITIAQVYERVDINRAGVHTILHSENRIKVSF